MLGKVKKLQVTVTIGSEIPDYKTASSPFLDESF